MKEDIAYKNIIEKIAVPVIVLEPQYHGRKIYDYKIIYLSSGLYPGVSDTASGKMPDAVSETAAAGNRLVLLSLVCNK